MSGQKYGERSGSTPCEQVNTESIDAVSNEEYIEKASSSTLKARRQATACIVLSLIAWGTYILVIPSVVCAVLSIIRGNRSRRILRTKRALAGLVLDWILLIVYGLLLIIIILMTLRS